MRGAKPANSDQPAVFILVIDDEEVVHASLTRILGRQGYGVDSALSAAEALELIAEDRYDLIITDLMMPKMNGIELLERLREMECSVPVLMITGYPSIRTAMQAMRLGAVDYLPKPFTRQELLAPVLRSLRRQEASVSVGAEVQETRPGQDGIEPPPEVLSPGDRVRLRDHSWAQYHQDGTVEVGIEASFLDNVGAIKAVSMPGEGELVEQGHPSIRLTTDAGEQHSVFMPLSGQVLAINPAALANPGAIDVRTWLLRVVPSRLHEELEALTGNETR